MRGLYLFILIVLPMVIVGQDYTVQFAEGNFLFQEEKFQQALKVYQAVEDSGVISPDLYFNIGNAELKLDNYTRAILYYERALLLEDREDFQKNLELAQKRIIDPVPLFEDFFIKKWWLGLLTLLGSNGWLVLSVLLAILAAFGFTVFIRDLSYRNSKTLLISTCAVLLSLFSLFLSRSDAIRQAGQRHAIVMGEGYPVYGAADDKSQETRLLSSGVKVEIVDQIGDWLKVEMPDKDKGWMPSRSVEFIEDAVKQKDPQ